MDASAFYAYLTRARRDLWAELRRPSDGDLSRPVVPAQGARWLKDLALHVATAEDGWFRGDLLGRPLMFGRLGWPEPASADGDWHHEDKPLDTLLAYWEAVEAATLAGWPELLEVAASGRRIPVGESRPETLSADEVLWHVMGHEVRHTAQMGQMIRLLGHTPPSLDLVFVLGR